MVYKIRKRQEIQDEIEDKQLTSGMKLMLEVLLDIRINTSKIISELQILSGHNRNYIENIEEEKEEKEIFGK